MKVAATEIVSGVSGESEQKLRELFEKAVVSLPLTCLSVGGTNSYIEDCSANVCILIN